MTLRQNGGDTRTGIETACRGICGSQTLLNLQYVIRSEQYAHAV